MKNTVHVRGHRRKGKDGKTHNVKAHRARKPRANGKPRKYKWRKK